MTANVGFEGKDLKQLSHGLILTQKLPKKRFRPTFSDDKNLVTAVSIDDNPSSNVDYYIRWGTPRTTSSAVVDSFKLLLPDSFV